MTSPGNQHFANSIGALSLAIAYVLSSHGYLNTGGSVDRMSDFTFSLNLYF